MGDPKKHVIIVGAGIGGLACAVRLAGKFGCRVTVFEKNATVGGKLNLWTAPHPGRGPGERPFRFDTGPSLLTMPLVFADLFDAAGEDVRDHLTIRRLDPIARLCWPDGSQLTLHSDPGAQHAALRAFGASASDLAGWARLERRGRAIWERGGELFLFNAPEQVLSGRTAGGLSEGEERGWRGGLARLRGALGLLSTPLRIGMFRRFSKLIDREIADPRLRAALYQYATYSGASPFRAPATLAVIPFVERHFGGWAIDGGMYTLATALERVAREKLGVTIRTGCEVERILIDRAGASARAAARPAAHGVRLVGGEELGADAVVCNADALTAYRALIEPGHRPHYSDEKLRTFDPGGSGLVLMLGVEGAYPQLAHHTKFMPDDYSADLRAMFETRSVPDDPCIYVCASTRTDPTQAPDGCENLFVLCSAPPMYGGGERIDWAVEGPRYRSRIVQTLQTRWKLEGLQERIVVERMMAPPDLARVYGANAGAIYGLGGNRLRDAFLRPPNRDRRIDRLYLCGGATHPGGGLPLVALSGRIVSELIADDFSA